MALGRACNRSGCNCRDEQWRVLRQAWQPAFHTDSLAAYAPRMSTSIGHLQARLAGLADQVVDICPEVGKLTLDVVGGSAYG